MFCFIKNFNYVKFNCILDNSQAKNKLFLILDVQKTPITDSLGWSTVRAIIIYSFKQLLVGLVCTVCNSKTYTVFAYIDWFSRLWFNIQ